VPLAGVTVNQLPPAAVAVNAIGELPDSAIVCGSGRVPPVWYVYVSEAGLTPIVGALLTVRVTGTVCGLLLAPAAAIVMLPLYVPAASPVGFTPIIRVAGVVPLVGVTVNQPPPAAVAVNAIGELPDNAIVCAGGGAPPLWCVYVSEVGLTPMVGALLTVRVTGTVCGLLLAPGAVIVTDAVYVPAASPVGFTPTVRVAGVVPLVGVTVNQLPPAAVAVNAIGELPDNAIVCAGAGAPPLWCVYVSEVGLTPIVGALLTVRVTGTVCGLLLAPGAVIATLPLYVPAASPVGFTPTVRVVGVVPLAGVTVNQLPPAVVAVNAIGEVVVTEIIFGMSCD
jgi:hypothetical protein